MPKRIIFQCHWCRQPIYSGEQYKVYTTQDGSFRYHNDHGLDCCQEEIHHKLLREVEDEWEHDQEAVRGYD